MFLVRDAVYTPAVIGSLAAILLLALIIELPSKKLPNWITISGCCVGLALAIYDGNWMFHLAGMFTSFAVALLFYLIGASGAGLVKLCAAIGAIAGSVVGISASVASLPLFFAGDAIRAFLAPNQDEKQRRWLPGSVVATTGSVIAVATLLYLRSQSG